MGYKYSNKSNIIISTKPEISCVWKPDNLNDGFKDCEAIFEIENNNIVRPIIIFPRTKFDFVKNNTRNITSEFSDVFNFINETFLNITENGTEEIIIFEKREFIGFTTLPNSIDTRKPFAIRLTYESPKYDNNDFNFSLSALGFNGLIDPSQNSCATLSTAGTYTVETDLSATGTCMTITATEVVLDCQTNATITFGTGGGDNVYGVTSTVNRTTVRNCIINESLTTAGSGRMGVRMAPSHHTIVENNTIYNRRGTSGAGAYIIGSLNVTVKNNKINSTTVEASIVLVATNSSLITNNTIFTFDGPNGVGIQTRSKEDVITLNNITVINGTGSGILFDSGANTGSGFINITSNIIYGGVSGQSDGIEIPGATNPDPNNILIQNNIINTTATSSDGMEIIRGENITLINNNVTATGASGWGLHLASSAGINVTNLKVYGGNYTSYADISIYLENVFDSVFENVTVVSFSTGVSDTALSFGTLGVSNNLTFKNVNFLRRGVSAQAVRVETSHTTNASFIDSVMNSSSNAFRILQGASKHSGYFNFTNVTNGTGTDVQFTWDAGANATVAVGWWADILANYTNGTIASESNLSGFDRNNVLFFSNLSGSDGRHRQLLYEYVRNDSGGETIVYYSNYTLNASRPDRGQNLTQSWNMTVNRNIVFQFDTPAGVGGQTNTSIALIDVVNTDTSLNTRGTFLKSLFDINILSLTVNTIKTTLLTISDVIVSVVSVLTNNLFNQQSLINVLTDISQGITIISPNLISLFDVVRTFLDTNINILLTRSIADIVSSNLLVSSSQIFTRIFTDVVNSAVILGQTIKIVVFNLIDNVNVSVILTRSISLLINIIDIIITAISLGIVGEVEAVVSVSPSGSFSNVILQDISPDICHYTHNYIQNNSKDYSKITDLKNLILLEKNKTYSNDILINYINRWQFYCSDLINTTLESDFVCNKVYYFLLNNHQGYSTDDIIDLKKDIDNRVSISARLTEEYVSKYDSLCYGAGYSDKIPTDPLEKIKILGSLSKSYCSTEIGNLFFDINIPFNIKIFLGQMSCSRINIYRWFVGLESDGEGNYSIYGVKMWHVVFGAFIFSILLWIYILRVKNRIEKMEMKEKEK